MKYAAALVVGALSIQALTGTQSEPVDTIVREEMASQRIPGVAVAVIRRGAVKAQGYGLANVEHQVAVTD
ncbi:MAG TPA: serine hydrolase, partial [Vicinamibacterales bacterium]|nr:serine hydrolase [Vicinamibacterales bacterium]